MNSSRGIVVPVLHSPDYLTIYDWEKNFDLHGMREWMSMHWIGSIYISVLYVVFIFGTQYYMQPRKPFRLTAPLVFWNVALAIFSAMVLLRTLPEFLRKTTSPNGLHKSMCHWTEHNAATAYWSYLFMCSKLVELGDTVFIVLRKQKLIFLHWYHHIMTLITACLMAVDYEPHQLWYIVMNSFIHTLMYSYYALKAAKVKVPRSWAMAITTMQLIQMVFGVGVNVYALNVMWIQGKESECERGYFGLKLSFAVGTSYLFLFAHFFYKSYIHPKRSVQFKSNGVSSLQSLTSTMKKID